ncbi:MAG: hypothetical protein KZQ64_15075 [gamma proteobacterium symbiont of Bathyaustriella thionipta]|nr:hypothetical protein [gamma proteobacterium symbiont of Bathyaustriella thionipta]MCU7949949.1 hypothetical protein [gamma proteobacterium symbiont of Bathyaustriella thionipta]MCU7954691.1 hypothetical protein [gamma proteobacterium symbiont of Bathyaustriella thionipta]MCU7956514.1 hypothetical protein [gamma proteobacterium symbiont of Bathyaustriella thionipta]MCU7966838.1 hypothetical protein [gamma proteobacterium symbiont of Bathyaustriella thionipta]
MKILHDLLKLTVFPVAVLCSMPVFPVQDVYQYQNKEGVTEFTDHVKGNKTPQRQFQIQKRTAEQEAQSQQKLNEIIEKDRQLDKKIARDRALENERLRRQQKAKEDDSKEPSSDSDSGGRWRNGIYYPPRPVHPIHPGRPNRPGKLR